MEIGHLPYWRVKMVRKNDNGNTASTVIPEILMIAIGVVIAAALAAYAILL
jgi:hypothetical protein